VNGVLVHRAKTSNAWYRKPREFTTPHVAYPAAEAHVLEMIVEYAAQACVYPSDVGRRDLLLRSVDELHAMRKKP